MIGEVIVWSSVTNTSLERESVINNVITSENVIGFEILLHLGHAAVHVSDHSKFTSESEILIAASSVFMVEPIEIIDISIEREREDHVTQLTIPLVKLIYWMSSSEFDIDERPGTILL
jgi:hypothetical protein